MERESQGFTVATLTTLVLLSLVGTLTLGVGLRWALAGVPLLPGGFVELRHAHSHLGYYGVLFPLMWWAWGRLGQRAPGLGLLGLYAVGVVMSAVGFAREGYGRPAIIGSTIVLGVWLASAWRLRGVMMQPRSWLGGAAPTIVLGALCIGPVAVVSGRDPALATGLVRMFLTLLLLGAVTPAALAALRAPAPPWPIWLGAVLCGAAFLGPLPHPALGLGLLVVGVLLGRAALRAPSLGWDERGLWLAFALGLVAPGVGLVSPGHNLAVAGVHFAALGPLLVTLTRPLWPARPPAWARWSYAVSVGAFATALLVGESRLAAVFGSVVAALWALGVVWIVRHTLTQGAPLSVRVGTSA